MYVENFSHWNYTNIWCNKVLLAWYFKKLQSSNFTGENELVSSCLLIDFDDSEADTISGGNVLCHTKEKGFANSHLT